MSSSAFVLHSRPYKETSALLELFTPQGRLCAVLRGARGRSGSLARPFVPLELEVRGRHELKNVARLEVIGVPLWLRGPALYSGLYLNELLMRLLPSEDPYPAFFEHYTMTLLALAAGRPLEPLLRAFEWRLLDTLGYGLVLDQDVTGAAIQAAARYRFLPEAGFVLIHQLQPDSFSGLELQAMVQADWSQPNALLAAKRLMRQALAPHLGTRPLMSRALFMNPKGTCS